MLELGLWLSLAKKSIELLGLSRVKVHYSLFSTEILAKCSLREKNSKKSSSYSPSRCKQIDLIVFLAFYLLLTEIWMLNILVIDQQIKYIFHFQFQKVFISNFCTNSYRFTYFLPPIFRITGPFITLFAMIRNGEGGRRGPDSRCSSSSLN